MKQNNKGISLVELLVAIAVSGIILVMIGVVITEGTKHFKEESIRASLQNELQMVNSQLTQTIMEASMLDIVNGSDKIIYTGEISSVDNELLIVNGTEKIITVKNNNLYITNFNDTDGTKLTSGYSVSSNVEDFQISIDEGCLVENETDSDGNLIEDYYTNPLIIKINISLKKSDITVNGEMSVRLRNDISQVTVDGFVIDVE